MGMRPKDHVRNIGTLHFGSKVQEKGDSTNYCLQDPCVWLVFWSPLVETERDRQEVLPSVL